MAIGLRRAGATIPGLATVLCVVRLLGGIQLVAIGIIGEYAGRIYDEVKGRPLYLVRSARNFGHGDPRTKEAAEIERITARHRSATPPCAQRELRDCDRSHGHTEDPDEQRYEDHASIMAQEILSSVTKTV